MEAQPARCQLELEAYRLVRSRDAMTSGAANQKADAALNSYDINIGVLSRVYCEYTVVYGMWLLRCSWALSTATAALPEL